MADALADDHDMRPIRRILVAINNPGAMALPAVAKAARIAKACDAHVELFHAIQAYERALQDLHETQRSQYLQRLERIAARLRLHGIKVSTAVEYDCPAYEAIVRRAISTQADLIVARRHNEGRMLPGLLRLTDWELLRSSPVPVLLVKRSGPYRHPSVLAAVDPCHAHAKPTQLDQEILSAGSQIAAALRGKLHAVHAYAPVVVGSAATSISASAAARLDRIAASDARTEFDALLAGTSIPQTRRYLVGALPAVAVDGIARRTRAAIVVMGALSRSGLQRLFIGNTAERVLDQLPCDVLVVKPAEFVSQVPRECNDPRLSGRAR